MKLSIVLGTIKTSTFKAYIDDGILPHISTQRCLVCGHEAWRYHQTVDPVHNHLEVTPLCMQCLPPQVEQPEPEAQPGQANRTISQPPLFITNDRHGD
jgi:hypothetical protein